MKLVLLTEKKSFNFLHNIKKSLLLRLHFIGFNDFIVIGLILSKKKPFKIESSKLSLSLSVKM